MFALENIRFIYPEVAIISSNYRELISDDFPILYTGLNKHGSKIIGILVDEDEEQEFVRYFHILVKDDDLSKFFKKAKTIREIIENESTVFVLDKNYNGTLRHIEMIPVANIPVEYLPLRNSFCPDFVIDGTFEYGVSMKGGIADEHLATPEDVNLVDSATVIAMKNVLNSLSPLGVSVEVLERPRMAGSFRLNYLINIKQEPQHGIFHFDRKLYLKYISTFLKYVTSDVSQEVDKINTIEFNDTKVKLNELKDITEQLYENLGYTAPQTIEKDIINTIVSTYREFKKIETNIETNFDRIEFINYSTTGEEQPIGLINKEFYTTLDHIIEIQVPQTQATVRTDETAQRYSIMVYNLNKRSLHCSATVKINEEMIFDAVKIEVEGLTALTNTKYSKSLHEDLFISVLGKGTYENDRLKKISISEPFE